MKTKIFPVESENTSTNHLFDTKLIKHDFHRKIEQRLLAMRKRRQVIRRHNTNNSIGLKAKVFYAKIFKSQKSIIFTKKNMTTTELIPHIDSAMKLQQLITEAAIALNRKYNLQLLLIFLDAFISIIFNCYHMIAVFVEPEAFKLPQIESISYLLQDLMSPSLCITFIVVGFEMLKFSIRSTQKIVNKIIIHSMDNDIRTRFLAFSQQIQVNIPEFTVFGFFSLDGSVVFSMISSTTTHLIILVQSIGKPSEDGQSFSSSQVYQGNGTV